MSIYTKICLAAFGAGLVAGTYFAGQWLSVHPQDLAAFVWPFIKAEVFASNPATATWIVHGPGYAVQANDLIAAWQTQNPDGYRQLLRVLTLSPLAGLMAGLGLCSFLMYLDPGPGPVRHLRGRYMAGAKEVAAVAKRIYGAGLILLGSVCWPEWQEMEGLLLTGATGSGKTTAILACLDVAAQRRDRVIVTDQNGALMAHYMATNQVLLLNPFDVRAKPWSPLAEMSGIYDAMRLAKSMIPDARSGDSVQWTHYAQQMLAAVLERLYLRGHATNAELLRYFRPEGLEDLRALLPGKMVSAVFLPGNERLAGSVEGVLAMYLPAYEYLDPNAGADSFSITRWVQQGQYGWLWLTYMDNQLDALRPLIGTWLDIASSAMTSMPIVKRPPPAWQFWRERVEPRRIWNIVDEAKSIGKVQSLEDSITKGRKPGLRTVIGIQSISQLRELYGDDRTTTILGSLKSAAIFNTEDPDTQEYLSRRIGDAEVEITNTSSGRNKGELGNSHVGQSTQRTIRRVVLPTEIATLPNLSAYLVLSGVSAVAKITLEPRELQARIPAFIAKPNPPAPPPPPAAPANPTPAAVVPEFV